MGGKYTCTKPYVFVLQRSMWRATRVGLLTQSCRRTRVCISCSVRRVTPAAPSPASRPDSRPWRARERSCVPKPTNACPSSITPYTPALHHQTQQIHSRRLLPRLFRKFLAIKCIISFPSAPLSSEMAHAQEESVDLFGLAVEQRERRAWTILWINWWWNLLLLYYLQKNYWNKMHTSSANTCSVCFWEGILLYI